MNDPFFIYLFMFYRFTKLIDDTNLEDLHCAQEYQALGQNKRVDLRGAAPLTLSNLEIKSTKRTRKDDRLPLPKMPR